MTHTIQDTLDALSKIKDIKKNEPELVKRAAICTAIIKAIESSIMEYELNDQEVLSIVASLGSTACVAIPNVTPAVISTQIERMLELRKLVKSVREVMTA